MSPVYLNPPPLPSSPIIPSFMEVKGDQYKYNSLKDQEIFGRRRIQSNHVLSQTSGKNPSYYSHQRSMAIEFSSHDQDLTVDNSLSLGKSNDLSQNNGSNGGFHHGYNQMSDHKEVGDEVGIGIINCDNENKNSKKWKPSKVRITQKMVVTSKHIHKAGEDHQLNKLQQDIEKGQRGLRNNNYNKNNNNSVIRVCSDCRTTTTPLWRSGPQGPKSLCNACGIRQRKARRAAMAAAAGGGLVTDNGIVAPIAFTKPPKDTIHHEDMRETRVNNNNESNPLALKKRGKTTDVDKCGLFSTSNDKDYVASLYYYSKKRALPRDEEEGAILLMALSSGLACSS